MYESFFGLQEKPFNMTPDPRYFYLSESHREALAALIYGVRERAGLITLTGRVGLGKTMVLSSFLDQIWDHAETASFFGAVSESRVEFLKDLCGVLEIHPRQDSLFGVSRAIQDFAIRKAEEGRSVVVLVDEAQELGVEGLEHFHHLSNLETPRTKLVQIVLAGTERLDENLQDPRLEALWQRVSIRCSIQAISPKETLEYIFFRLRAAGGNGTGLFTEEALCRIVNFTRGVPRLINLVCNQALISAYSSGRLPVDEQSVLEALQGLEGARTGRPEAALVSPEEIGGMVEAVSRSRRVSLSRDREPNPAVSEAETGEGDRGAGEEQRGAAGRRNRKGLSGLILPVRKPALAISLILLLAMAGVVMAIGLLRARDDTPGRIQPTSLGESDAGRERDSRDDEHQGQEAKMDAAGQGGRENEFDGARPGNAPESRFRIEEGPPASEGGLESVQQGIAGIALERYGRLDIEVLKVLREKNPHIRDWNNLAGNVRLVLPDVPEPTNGGADFYSIQVGAFRNEEGAHQRASELAERGAQNLFLLRGGEEKRLTFVCVGVFESGRQSSGSLGRMKEWGYEDAFPIRIRGDQLEDILQPTSLIP